MKKIVLLLLFAPFFVQSQNKVLFTYDSAGNQIVRQLCINCLTGKQDLSKEEIIALQEEEKEKFSPEESFSFYPNPVQEELYLFWTPTTTDTPNSIQVHSVNGQLLYTTTSILNNTSYQVIPFSNYPTGVYLVNINYPSKSAKFIKIIKK
jgi:hypothetical protein